jgi:iron complex outermembrane receptor protein
MLLQRLFYILVIITTPLVQADDLTPLEVKSYLLSNTIDESRYPLSIIDGDQIDSSISIGSNIGSSINRVPGVSNSDYGVAVGQAVIRGLGGNRVKVLSDNDNVNDLSFISSDHPNMVNIGNASHIEVIKGPASIFNYGGTTGGIINVVTGSITDSPYSDQMIRLGRTYDTVSEGYSNNILMKKNIGDLSVYFSHNKRDHFNYDMPEGSLYEEGEEKHTLANSDFADKNLTAGISLIKDWGYIGFSVEDNKGTFGIPYHAEEEEEEEEEGHGEHRIYSTHKTDNYKIKGRLDNLSIANSVDFSFNNSNSSIKEHEEDGSFKVLNNNSSSWNLKFNLDNENMNRRLLVAYNHAKSPMSSSAYIPSSDSYDQSIAYFMNSGHLGYDIDVAVRYDNNERLTTGKNYEDSAISFSANSIFSITDSLKYSIGYSHVSRSPNMAELFADGKHGPTNRYEKGDSNLKREISRNIDFGIAYNYKDTLISLDLYRNNINNYIYLRDLGTTSYDGEHQDANWSQKDSVIQGYELSLEKSFIVGNRDFIVTLSRDDISAVFDDNTYLPRIPSASNMIGVTVLGEKNKRYYLNLTHVEKQKDFSSIESSSNSYSDLSVKYSDKIMISNHYDLNINLFASNLLDQTIRNHASFVKAHVPLPGSSFGFDVSVDYKF